MTNLSCCDSHLQKLQNYAFSAKIGQKKNQIPRIRHKFYLWVGTPALEKKHLTPRKFAEIIENHKAEIRWNFFCFTVLLHAPPLGRSHMQLHAACYMQLPAACCTQQSAARRNNVQLLHAAPLLLQKHYKQKKSKCCQWDSNPWRIAIFGISPRCSNH